MSTTVRVKPSNKDGVQSPPPIPLTVFDLLVPHVYVPIHIFFQPSSGSSSMNQTKVLDIISAFADVLEWFPPLAGSVQRDKYGGISVHSDRRGSDFSYETRNHDYPGETAENLCPRGTVPNPSDGNSPLVSVKLTSFLCGSHVMVISFAHILIDLFSAMDFIRAFANRVVGGSRPILPKRWTRNPLEYFPDTPALLRVPGFVIKPSSQAGRTPQSPSPTSEVFVCIPRTELAAFKSSFRLSISDFQLLAALLWRASAACCSSDAAGEDILYLGIAANGRERSPDKLMAKDHYFGNFVTDVSVALKKSDLLAEGISSVAGAIKVAIKEQLTPEHIAGKIKTFQSLSLDQLEPQFQTRVSFWSKDVLDTKDLGFGLVEPGTGNVTVTPGNNIRFPVGNIHISMPTEDEYRVQLTVPEGRENEIKLGEELAVLLLREGQT